MNLTSKQKRELFTKNGDLKSWFKRAYDNCVIKGNKVYLTKSSKRGVTSYEGDFIKFLNLFGYKYSHGNSAPRGGSSGDYIKVGNACLKRFLSLRIQDLVTNK